MPTNVPELDADTGTSPASDTPASDTPIDGEPTEPAEPTEPTEPEEEPTEPGDDLPPAPPPPDLGPPQIDPEPDDPPAWATGPGYWKKNDEPGPDGQLWRRTWEWVQYTDAEQAGQYARALLAEFGELGDLIDPDRIAVPVKSYTIPASIPVIGGLTICQSGDLNLTRAHLAAVATGIGHVAKAAGALTQIAAPATLSRMAAPASDDPTVPPTPDVGRIV